MGKCSRKRGEKKMSIALIVLFAVLFLIVLYLLIQGIRCGISVKEGDKRLLSYNAKTADLSYCSLPRKTQKIDKQIAKK